MCTWNEQQPTEKKKKMVETREKKILQIQLSAL